MNQGTKLRQNILPLECVEDSVDNGITTTIFLSPEECEELLNPQPVPVTPDLPDTTFVVTPVPRLPLIPRKQQIETDELPGGPEPLVTVPGGKMARVPLKTHTVSIHSEQPGQFYDPTTVIVPTLVAGFVLVSFIWLVVDYFLHVHLSKR